MKLFVQDGAFIDNDYWFCCMNSEGLFRYSFDDHVVSLVDPDLSGCRRIRPFNNLDLFGNRIVLSPGSSDYVVSVDLNSFEKKEEYHIKNKHIVNNYMNTLFLKDKLYFVPYSNDEFLSYDLNDGVRVIDSWENLRRQSGMEFVNDLVFGNALSFGEIGVIPVASEGTLILFDPLTESFDLSRLSMDEDERIESCSSDGENIWIVTSKKRLYKWNIDGVFELVTYINDFEENIHYCIPVGNSFFLVNAYDRNIWRFDINSKAVFPVNLENHVLTKNDDDMSVYCYSDYFVRNECLYLFSNYSSAYVCVNSAGEYIASIGIGVNDQIRKNVIDVYCKERVIEEGNFDLLFGVDSHRALPEYIKSIIG